MGLNKAWTNLWMEPNVQKPFQYPSLRMWTWPLQGITLISLILYKFFLTSIHAVAWMWMFLFWSPWWSTQLSNHYPSSPSLRCSKFKLLKTGNQLNCSKLNSLLSRLSTSNSSKPFISSKKWPFWTNRKLPRWWMLLEVVVVEIHIYE